ncbi:MAG: hypothetical protein CVU49_09560 [Candidatus Cloacimonetes bacterium HGW-Cloacimonetes-2]|jgi:hypothetical protein|nr:MAG: hypothetical protein CVU49_09560 [Candidatus Cloacimonetes bacterium HGW-Cloacimonetes-2]
MKLAVLSIILLLTVLSLGASVFDNLNPVAQKAIEHVRTLSGEKYQFDQHAAIFGGLIDEDESLSMSYDLVSGKAYKIFLFGDDEAYDLDLKVYDEDDVMVESDTSTDDTSFLTFTPASNGVYRIEAINYSSYEATFLICGLMSPGTRTNNHTELFSQAMNKLITFGKESDSSNSYHFVPNTIAFSGGLVASGENGCVYGLSLPGEYTVKIGAVGSNNSTDVDIKVTRQTSREEADVDWYASDAGEIAADSSTDDTALITATLSEDNYYAYKYRNYSSTGNAFLIYFVATEGEVSSKPSDDDDDWDDDDWWW